MKNTKNKVVGLIQARMNSERLPGKVLLPILGKPVIWHMHNRLKQSKLLDNVVISTSSNKENQKIRDFASNENIPYFSGSELDLLDRMYQAALQYNATTVVRITGDCPFVDPQIVDLMLSEYFNKKTEYDLALNSKIHTFPHGLEVEIYPIETLRKLLSKISQPEFREWFIIYLYKHDKDFKILNITNKKNLSKIRLTIDYQEDYEFTKLIYQELYRDNHIFLMDEIVDLLSRKPELIKINSKYSDHRNIDAPI